MDRGRGSSSRARDRPRPVETEHRVLTEEPRTGTEPTSLRPARHIPSRRRCSPASSFRPTGFGYRLKNKLLGPPLHTEQLEHERLGKPTALAVFASDNLSVVGVRHRRDAAGPDSGSRPRRVRARRADHHRAARRCCCFLILSYRQTIKAYPSAGGAYMVTRDNFGLLPAQVAGVALLTDYVLTVSVSVAAGTAALASAFSVFTPWILPISISVRGHHRLGQPARRAASRGRSSRSPPTSSSSTWPC